MHRNDSDETDRFCLWMRTVPVGLCILEFCRNIAKTKGLTTYQLNMLRFKVSAVVGCLIIAVAAYLAPSGYFGPISSRIRSLFVAHTRTGNPLVDSVAEHQPASDGLNRHADCSISLDNADADADAVAVSDAEAQILYLQTSR
jgi:hypothetical protein